MYTPRMQYVQKHADGTADRPLDGAACSLYGVFVLGQLIDAKHCKDTTCMIQIIYTDSCWKRIHEL